MTLQNVSTRERRLALLTLALVVTAAVYRVAIFPELSRMWRLSDRAEAARVRLLEMEGALALSERIEERYKTYEDAIAQQGSDSVELVNFFKTVRDITSACDMEIVLQEQLPVKVTDYYKLFSMNLGVRTRPVQLARFLASLETSNQIIRVESITVKALDDSENLSVSMKLTKVVASERGSR